MYSNLPTLKIHINIYSIKPAKYQCKIHIHIYRCILPNINVFNLPTLIIHTHTHTYIEPANFIIIIFFFLRKNLSNINLLKLANFKNPHTYIYMQLAKYFWEKIWQYFCENNTYGTIRSDSFLSGLWGTINRKTSKFVGFMAKVEAQNQSNATDQMKI